jgi:hypothetical protein
MLGHETDYALARRAVGDLLQEADPYRNARPADAPPDDYDEIAGRMLAALTTCLTLDDAQAELKAWGLDRRVEERVWRIVDDAGLHPTSQL